MAGYDGILDWTFLPCALAVVPEPDDHLGSERLEDDYRIMRNIMGLHDPMVQGVLLAAKLKRKKQMEAEHGT